MTIETSSYFGYYSKKDGFIMSQIEEMRSMMVALSRGIHPKSTSVIHSMKRGTAIF